MFRGLLYGVAVVGMFASASMGTTFVCAQEKVDLLGMPLKAMATGGTLMICGGGKLSNSIYDEFVRIAGGRRARIILIPSAYPYESPEQMATRFADWKNYDVMTFNFLDTDDPEEADDADFVAPLEDATGVWIAGGAQSRLLHRYGGRKVQNALHRVVARGGIVAGDSAGSAVFSRTVIRGGDATEAVLDKGLGLLDLAVVDTHFSQRARHTRLLKIVNENPELIGLGVDETSALIIRQNRVRVLGDASATLMISRGANRAVVVHQMCDGDVADLSIVSSPFGSGSPTVELLPRSKPRELLPQARAGGEAINTK